MQLEQIHELQDRLDEEREHLRLLQQTLKQERAARAHGGGARERARDVNRRIVEDRAVEPRFSIEPARTWSQPPCSFVTCPSHRTLRPVDP
jgi:hypothetical protein